MFGSDWPLCTLAGPYRDWVGAVKAIVSQRSEADQRRLFHDNAVRFYGLG
jgi:L-fuconolactonase